MYNKDSIGIGTVITVPPQVETDVVEVTWDNGRTFKYRMGWNNMYDLQLAK